ncbi:hypothetical protein [Pseudofrankia inefficax]|uniref:Uncharacterized protein n=1 Tax=Pseudofrankia inefficax (strain DSM 45817 / CECT 9037 / DDB 130130 / EuI1c) TaxID=298654 RepID=E3IZ77_PSEI1|nr:hypothetical protein [Pseudofrankia inefficax]ADP81504.1 hypothetical protein FraEuI1c_3495 [Pseudofrankia inefficax]
MTRIGFEWQFKPGQLAMKSMAGVQLALPSKSLVFRADGVGVNIESDSGEVEIVTDPVDEWDDLVPQLVLIGDLMSVLSSVAPDPAKLTNQRVAALLAPLFGQGLADPSARSRRGAGLVTDGQLLAVNAQGNLQTALAAPEMRVSLPHRGKRSLVFAAPGPVYDTVTVVANNEVRPVLLPANTKIAIEATGTVMTGVAQCTIDADLTDVESLISPYYPGVTAKVDGWVGANNGVTFELRALFALVAYYLHAFSQPSIRYSNEGPKTGFNLLPRMNLRSIYRMLLDDDDRTEFDAVVRTIPGAELNAVVCPEDYKAGTDRIVNPLTLAQWLTSIRNGDLGAGVPTLDRDYSGLGPRGVDYDAMSPPLGYPAHAHPARTSTWFTYAMGRTNAVPDGPVVLEYRDVQAFGVKKESVTFEQFVDVAANAARAAGVQGVPA